jgi:hypothetical protein
VKSHTTLYDLVGIVSRIGGLAAALVVIAAGAFQSVAGWTLAVRVLTTFVVVTALLNLLGFVLMRSLLAGVVVREEVRKKETPGPKRA